MHICVLQSSSSLVFCFVFHAEMPCELKHSKVVEKTPVKKGVQQNWPVLLLREAGVAHSLSPLSITVTLANRGHL